jgi:uncharacterized protein YjbJ (UPF0337 family)
MGGKMDKAKGRMKEAAGSVLDDPKLKREGRKDKTKGKVKGKVDKASAKTKEAVDKVAHSRKRTVNRDNM